MKRRSRIGTWIKDALLVALIGYVIFDISVHSFSNGYSLGLQHGFQQGLQQPPQLWKSGGNTGKITESRQPGQDAPSTT